MQQNDTPYGLLTTHFEALGVDRIVIGEMLSLFKVRRYRKGDSFSTEGEETDRLGFVADGVFFMFAVQEDGGLFVKDFPAKSQYLLASFEPGGPAMVSIQTLVDATVLEAPYSAVCFLLRKYPELERAARRGAERRMEGLHKRLESFATAEASERYRLFRQDFGSIEDRIPQYLIASYLGITPTQLSRIKKQGRPDICK